MVSWSHFKLRKSQLYLVLGEAVSLGGVIALGDGASQLIEQRGSSTPFKFDYKRSYAMSITGLFYMAPLTMAWFPFLHRFMATRMSHLVEGTIPYVAAKVMLENFFLAFPVCLGFFLIPPFIEGGSQAESVSTRMRKDFLPSFWTDVIFWTCVAPINYKFVNIKYQAAFSCTFGGVEASGLSYLTHIDGFEWPWFLSFRGNSDDK